MKIARVVAHKGLFALALEKRRLPDKPPSLRMEYPIEKHQGREVVRKARNRRKRIRQIRKRRQGLALLTALSIAGKPCLAETPRRAHQIATAWGFTHTQWRGRLRRCSKPTPKKEQS